VELRGDDLVFSAFKPSADGRSVILRCYNPGDRPAAGVVAFHPPVGAVVRVTADERESGPAPLAANRREMALTLAPGEILSLRIDPE